MTFASLLRVVLHRYTFHGQEIKFLFLIWMNMNEDDTHKYSREKMVCNTYYWVHLKCLWKTFKVKNASKQMVNNVGARKDDFALILFCNIVFENKTLVVTKRWLFLCFTTLFCCRVWAHNDLWKILSRRMIKVYD